MNQSPGDQAAAVAELYDLMPTYERRPDVAFYVDICRSAGGKVLELGCGTGRVLLPIAAAGIDIVGVDICPHMLARCRQKVSSRPAEVQRRVRLVQAGMSDFELDDTFRTAIIPFRPFQHLLPVTAQRACLDRIHDVLEPGGTLVFDCFQVNMARMADPSRRQEAEDFEALPLPDGRTLRRCSRIAALHPAEQYNDVELVYYLTDGAGRTQRLVQRFAFRYFFRYELEHLLARAGFEVQAVYGDFDRAPLDDDSPEMIFIARKGRPRVRAEQG